VIHTFNPRAGLIIVTAEVGGPLRSAILRLALDTGATSTLINAGILVSIGYDPALSADRVEITMGSGIEFAPQLHISQINALGQVRKIFPILCHTLPPSAAVDGLLGLDFLRGQVLSVDFNRGHIKLR
jgi:hypothetical protein